jgi:hypothetical protein
MGDIADAIIEGELCQECACWIDDNIQGFPRYCEDCKPKTKTISDKKRASLRAKRKRRRQRKREQNNE